jgi:hypothetical protein
MEEMPLKTLEELEAECLRAKVGKRCLDAQALRALHHSIPGGSALASLI